MRSAHTRQDRNGEHEKKAKTRGNSMRDPRDLMLEMLEDSKRSDAKISLRSFQRPDWETMLESWTELKCLNVQGERCWYSLGVLWLWTELYEQVRQCDLLAMNRNLYDSCSDRKTKHSVDLGEPVWTGQSRDHSQCDIHKVTFTVQTISTRATRNLQPTRPHIQPGCLSDKTVNQLWSPFIQR